MLVIKNEYTEDTESGNKYWKTKAKIKFDMYRMDTREDLIKAGYNMETLDKYQGLYCEVIRSQVHNWIAIQAICGMVFIENDAGMNDYHNYVICKLAKNFGLKLDSSLLEANEKKIIKLLKDAAKKKDSSSKNFNKVLYDNIFRRDIFVKDIKTWNFMMQMLAQDVDAEWWCTPNNFKRNPKFSIKMLKNQYTKEYWKENEEQ